MVLVLREVRPSVSLCRELPGQAEGMGPGSSPWGRRCVMKTREGWRQSGEKEERQTWRVNG